jgi:succinate dehydrogenase flavin-adding protein (antitoxin of CptAB toxin-antitoxin module)
LKKFAQKYIQELSDKEKLEFLKGIDKDKVWEMAEGKAKQDVDLQGEITSKIIKLDE